MGTIRGRAKQDLDRAAQNAKRVPERLYWLLEEYSDYPDFVKSVEDVITSCVMIEECCFDLKALLP